MEINWYRTVAHMELSEYSGNSSKPDRCKVCKKTFKTRSGYFRHIEKNHESEKTKIINEMVSVRQRD